MVMSPPTFGGLERGPFYDMPPQPSASLRAAIGQIAMEDDPLQGSIREGPVPVDWPQPGRTHQPVADQRRVSAIAPRPVGGGLIPSSPAGPPGAASSVGGSPPGAQPLTPQQWAAQNFPEIADGRKYPTLPISTMKALEGAYSDYLTTWRHQSSMTAQAALLEQGYAEIAQRRENQDSQERIAADRVPPNLVAYITKLQESGRWKNVDPKLQKLLLEVVGREGAESSPTTFEAGLTRRMSGGEKIGPDDPMLGLWRERGGKAAPRVATEEQLKAKIAGESLAAGDDPLTALAKLRAVGKAGKEPRGMIDSRKLSDRLYGGETLIGPSRIYKKGDLTKKSLDAWSEMYDMVAQDAPYLSKSDARRFVKGLRDDAPSSDDILSAYEKGAFGPAKQWADPKKPRPESVRAAQEILNRLIELDDLYAEYVGGNALKPSMTEREAPEEDAENEESEGY